MRLDVYENLETLKKYARSSSRHVRKNILNGKHSKRVCFVHKVNDFQIR